MKKESRVLLSAILGNGLEFYDWTLMGAFTLKFAQLFSAAGSNSFSKGMVASVIFGAGFFCRPMGALVFGYIGDRIGRRLSLGLSILLMGVCTALIGLMPTYETLGVLSPALVVFFRCCQGLCVGGENNGSTVFAIEHTKKNHNLISALILAGGGIGMILAYGSSVLVSRYAEISWAWRVPFIAGFFISLIGLYIRHHLPESKEFEQDQIQRKRGTSQGHDMVPMALVWKNYRRPFLCSIGIGALCPNFYYTATTYLHVYLANVAHIPVQSALTYACVTSALFGFGFAPLLGWLADRTSARKVMTAVSISMCFLSLPFFQLLYVGTPLAIALAAIMISVAIGGFNGPATAFMSSLFPVSVRYTAVAFGYSLGCAFFGGISLMAYNSLIQWTGHPLSPCLYLGGMSLLGFLGVHYAFPKKTPNLTAKVSALSL